MIKRNKAIAGLLLFTMLMSGIPEGFGIVSSVYADETAQSVEAVAESDGFSYYTVEFTYNNLQYVLNGGESVALSEILSTVGLVGEAAEVTVSDSELFSASKENGKWIITAHKAFSSDEWMRVTIGDITYEITVTDDISGGFTYTVTDGKAEITEYNGAGGNVVIPATIGDSYYPVTSIGANAFNGCSSLTSITIPAGVTSLDTNTFYGCSSLTSITIPQNSSLTSIGVNAFFGCSSLESVTIPSGVTSIGNNTFYGCIALTSVVFKGTITATNLSNSAFNSSNNISTVYYYGDNWDDISGRFPASVTRNSIVIGDIDDHVYDGTAYNPEPSVSYAGPLTRETDYSLSYQKQNGTAWNDVTNAEVKNVGKYRVKVTGKTGTDYAGMTAYSDDDFSIAPKAVTITAQDKTFTYDGNPHSWSGYDVTGLVGGDEISATITGSISSISQSPVANVVASYEFRSGLASNYTVTTQNGQLTMTKNPICTITFYANNGTGVTAVQDAEKGTTVGLKPNGFTYAGHTFKEWNDKADGSGKSYKDQESIPVNADMSLYAQWTEDDHDEEPTPNNNVEYTDGFDELRVLLNNATSAAKATGLEQIVTWDKGTSLPYDIMKILQDNPKVTLVFSYTYQDHNFMVTIPGSVVIADSAIPWYGPLYLYVLYGKNKMPAITTSAGTYTVKSGDTLSAIAKRLKTTIKHLKDVNNIKNVDKIWSGMILKY